MDLKILKDSLKYLHIMYHKNLVGLDSLNVLQYLKIEKDNDTVILPEHIEHLELFFSKRTNLNFLRELKSLKKLHLFSSVKLQDLKNILSDIHKEELEIERCTKLRLKN